VDHKLTDSLKLIGGFQANKVGSISLSVVPRGGIIWKPASHWSVKALYSQAFRAPSLMETLIHYIPPAWVGGPSLLGNPDLSPEKVATVDIGLGYQGNRFEAGVDYFHSRQTDSIVEANQTTAGTYVNLGSTTFDGVEGEVKYYLSKELFLMGSTLYQANEDANGNTNVTPIPNFGAKAGISYQSANGFTASLFNDYEGHMNGYAAALNPKPGAYSMLDANVRMDLSKYLHMGGGQGLALVAHGENLANKAIWLPDWKDVPGDSIFVNQGRVLYIGIEISLEKE
jgi:outer membrane receptor for ferrienterochelin and colicin